MEGKERGMEDKYLFFFVALLAEVFATPCHFGTPHRMLFGCEMLFDFNFCRMV
jgi:hypothetical protein